MEKDINNIFSYHVPKSGQSERYEIIRSCAKQLAYVIEANCPDCEDRKEAIKQLRTAVMFANASIAINE